MFDLDGTLLDLRFCSECAKNVQYNYYDGTSKNVYDENAMCIHFSEQA
jgi:hypothetical protein